ncbi:MAG TPA: energy transducer TonB [Flavobacteriales bacterium]|nr:energy transducer TonB [Flavobacteriales bacterium]HRP81566.1 energy transducer TonB [Flavobacteriales bacterium]HRQ85069.1 energy transducer TonB [Flavobacteriales bacterium]
MITATLLTLFALVCIAMGAQRSWSDETLVERNALVFQGRNQEYGAYRLRRNYHQRLLLAIVATFGLLALVVGFSKLLATGAPAAPPPPVDTVVEVDLERTYTPPAPKPKPAVAMAPTTPRSTTTEERPVEVVDSIVAARPVPKDTAELNRAAGGSGTGHVASAGPAGGAGAAAGGSGHATDIDTVWNPLEVQEMPAFPGGDAALQAWMQDHLDLPAGPAGRGMVFMQFTVMRDGSLRDVRAVKGGNSAVKDAAERAVKRMPRWAPGRMNGHAVRCRLTLPIRYETR